jgi:hypothetical protein
MTMVHLKGRNGLTVMLIILTLVRNDMIELMHQETVYTDIIRFNKFQ